MELLKKIDFKELFRYGTVTLVSYVFLYAANYLLVDKLGFNPQVSYFISLTLVYVGVYVSYTMFVFSKKFDKQTFLRFVLALVIIWLINNVFFYLLNKILGINYLIAITLNLVILGAGRYFFQKYYVFRE